MSVFFLYVWGITHILCLHYLFPLYLTRAYFCCLACHLWPGQIKAVTLQLIFDLWTDLLRITVFLFEFSHWLLSLPLLSWTLNMELWLHNFGILFFVTILVISDQIFVYLLGSRLDYLKCSCYCNTVTVTHKCQINDIIKQLAYCMSLKFYTSFNLYMGWC